MSRLYPESESALKNPARASSRGGDDDTCTYPMIGRSASLFVLHATMNASGTTHTTHPSPRNNVREIACSVVVVLFLRLRTDQPALLFEPLSKKRVMIPPNTPPATADIIGALNRRDTSTDNTATRTVVASVFAIALLDMLFDRGFITDQVFDGAQPTFE